MITLYKGQKCQWPKATVWQEIFLDWRKVAKYIMFVVQMSVV